MFEQIQRPHVGVKILECIVQPVQRRILSKPSCGSEDIDKVSSVCIKLPFNQAVELGLGSCLVKKQTTCRIDLFSILMCHACYME